jgi:hypothetical protein
MIIVCCGVFKLVIKPLDSNYIVQVSRVVVPIRSRVAEYVITFYSSATQI